MNQSYFSCFSCKHLIIKGEDEYWCKAYERDEGFISVAPCGVCCVIGWVYEKKGDME